MRNNPRNDWTIADVAKVCRTFGVNYQDPSKGSHAKVSDPSQAMILTIPFKRPIKPFYIKELVDYIDSVMTARALAERAKEPLAKQARPVQSRHNKGRS